MLKKFSVIKYFTRKQTQPNRQWLRMMKSIVYVHEYTCVIDSNLWIWLFELEFDLGQLNMI